MGYTKAEGIILPTMLTIIILVGIVLRFTLGKQSLKIRQIPLTVIGMGLFVLEVIKQVHHLWITKDWITWYLPLHFCSCLLLWLFLAAITRGQLQQLFYFCSICGGILMTILLYVAPRMIINTACENPLASFDKCHTFIFHFAAVAYWIWTLFLGVYQPRWPHVSQTIFIYTGYFLVVLIMAYALNTNYTNVLSTELKFLENIRLTAGQLIYTFIMFGIGVLAVSIVAITINLCLWAYQKRRRVTHKDAVRY